MGELYTQRGLIELGLAVDLKLVKLRPYDDESWYNLGCSYALANDTAAALTSLQKAIELGYDSLDWMEADEDLHSLHKLPEWKTLLHSIKKSS